VTNMDHRKEALKDGLFIVCALGYGLIEVMPEIWSRWLLLVPVLLGVIYFVLNAHDWPTRLIPWVFACVVVGRVTGHWWNNSRGAHMSPLMDGEGWFWLGLAAVCFVTRWWRSVHGQTSNDFNSKSS